MSSGGARLRALETLAGTVLVFDRMPPLETIAAWQDWELARVSMLGEGLTALRFGYEIAFE